MEESIFDQIWDTFGERKPNGVSLELFNFLKENFCKELQSWSAEKIVSFLWKFQRYYKSFFLDDIKQQLNDPDMKLMNAICSQFYQHINNLVPRSQWEDNFDFYWIRVNVTLATRQKETEKSSRFSDESEAAYNKRIEKKINSKYRKIYELESEKMEYEFFWKHENIWNEVEGFEEEVFCYLNAYYSDDEYILSWTQEDLKRFIFDFAENSIRWMFSVELKSWPAISDFEWIGEVYNDFARSSYRFKREEESVSEYFKIIDFSVLNEDSEKEQNPMYYNESEMEYERRIHNILSDKCKKIIEFQKVKLKTEAKKRFEKLKTEYPQIFKEYKYSGTIYGFPFRASLVTLNYGGKNIHVTYEDFMNWNNTDDFERYILETKN